MIRLLNKAHLGQRKMPYFLLHRVKLERIVLLTGRAVGICAYLVRLGQRVIQVESNYIILTGFTTLNSVLGSNVGRGRLGGIPLGILSAETRQVQLDMPADPADRDSQFYSKQVKSCFLILFSKRHKQFVILTKNGYPYLYWLIGEDFQVRINSHSLLSP